MENGTNYISVRVEDGLGHVASADDVFVVRKLGVPRVEENRLVRVRITEIGQEYCRAEAAGEAA